MIYLIALPIAIVTSLLWYLPAVRAQGENKVLQTKDYLKIALLYGFLFSTLLIMVTEITWDAIVKRTSLSGLALNITSDFLRAALLEELFKLLGFLLAKKNLGLKRKTDYMLAAGMIGLVYGVVEKSVTGNLASAIVGSIVPFHIIWQFNQGGHYFEYEKAKAANDQQTAKKEWMLAVPFTFLFHGVWDSILDIGMFIMNKEATAAQVSGILIITAAVVLGVIFSVKTVRKVCRTAQEEVPAVSNL